MPFELRLEWGTWAVCALALLGLVTAFRRQRHWSCWFRFASYGLLLWFALEPSMKSVPAASSKPGLSVLVDVSRSMGIEDPTARLEQAKGILKEHSRELERAFDVSYYQFAENASRIASDGVRRLEPKGNATDIAQALKQVWREKKDGERAVLLISDGAQNASGTTPLEMSFDGPVYAVSVGSAGALSDIALSDVRVPDFSFKGYPVELSLKVQGFGFRGRTVPVILESVEGETKRAVDSQKVSFKSSPSETEVSFRFVPSAVGSSNYRVRVPVQEGEVTAANNAADFRLEVGREKIRVLYLCGAPSPEYALLRQILKSDPSVELVSFVILRNPENVVPVSEEELSLIPFPVNDIFTVTLPEFDLLIFENFAYSRFGISMAHLDNVRRFVEDRGGGFMMIGGDNSFGRGGYQGTPLESILPVKMDPASETVESEPVTLRVLESRQPFFDLGSSQEETEKIWNSMPPLNGFHRLPGLKPGASLYASFRENGSPAVAGWQKGKGKVLALGTVSTWQWSLGLAKKGVLRPYYSQFWRNTIRWLTGTLDSRAVRLVLTETELTVGRKSAARIVLQAERLRSGKAPEVRLELIDSGGRIQPIPVSASGAYEFLGEWVPDRAGAYRLKAVVKTVSSQFEAEREVNVRNADLEMEDPYPKSAFLEEIAQKSGGEFFEGNDFNSGRLRDKIKRTESPQALAPSRPLWNHPALFLLMAGLLLLEWAFRRFRGMI